jgi:homopolymeric O-antigen transport system permease protein
MITSAETATFHIAIRPTRPRLISELVDLWQHRELCYFLAWRDVKVRYKQTILGVAWAVLQPALTMLVFTLFFGHLAKMPSDGMPYPLFAYAGILPWTLMASGVSASSGSIVGSPNLITKVYFPRMIIPAAAAVSGLVDFLVAVVGLVILMLRYRMPVTWHIFMAVPIVVLTLALACAVGGWLAAVTVRYRDIRYVVPFFMQLWLFATPVFYPASLIYGKWRLVLALNPMATYIEEFRRAWFGIAPDFAALALATTVTLAALATATYTFRSLERTFADYI